MDAMIFAAGLGTRLGPITARTPKALVRVGGRTMLERVAGRLVAAGADRLIINIHHHADQLRAAAAALDLPAEVILSPEEELLETGGGLLRAAPHFRRHGTFLLHNADVLSGIDLAALAAAQAAHAGPATLAVHERDSQRLLLFDDFGLLGRRLAATGADQRVREPRGVVRARAFTGIHAASGALLDRITERGKFSILDTYLRLATTEPIAAFEVGAAAWYEIGTPDRLAAAERDAIDL